MPQRGPLPEPANVIRDLEEADRDGFQVAACFYHRVFRALRFKVILGFAELDSGPLFEVPHHFAGELDVPVQPRANGRSAQGKFFQRSYGPLGTFTRIRNLPGISAEFLAEPDRRRVHQVGPTNFDDTPEFVRLYVERTM